ncbi:hypothetical protein Ccrd_004213, partial [Cynara cardunculus var. scolymus]
MRNRAISSPFFVLETDYSAVLSWNELTYEMSKAHRSCCHRERVLVDPLDGFVEDGYLNGQLGMTRAIGNWHFKGLKESGDKVGPLSAEPELKLVTLIEENEFLIIGCDEIWDAFKNQNE